VYTSILLQNHTEIEKGFTCNADTPMRCKIIFLRLDFQLNNNYVESHVSPNA
jgi:hypothetical protein